MLKLSKMTDYAVVVLAKLAVSDQEIMTTPEIADDIHLPRPAVAKILKILTRAGVVESKRGVQGGYRLERSPSHISIAEVITAIDGPVTLTNCVEEAEEPCTCSQSCPLQGRWQKVNDAVSNAIAAVSLAEVIAPCLDHAAFIHNQEGHTPMETSNHAG